MASSASPRSAATSVSAPARAALKAGVRLHHAGDLRGAIEVYRAILDKSPRNGDALNLLGTALAQQGQPSEGLEWIEAALAIHPTEPTYLANYAESHFQIGCLALESGRPEAAVESFAAAVASNPEHRDAQLNLGAACFQLGRLEEAEIAFSAVLELDPGDGEAVHNLAQVRQRLGNAAGALQALWDTLRNRPEDSVAWGEFAEAFERSHFTDSVPLEELQGVAVLLLRRDDIDHRSLGAQIGRLLRRDPDMAPLLEAARTGSDRDLSVHLFDEGGIEVLRRPIVRLALERTIIPDLDFEALFTRLRRLALETFVSGRSIVPGSILVSLARQCHLNGYIWHFDRNQVAAVEWLAHSAEGRGLGAIGDTARVALLGAYVSLGAWDRAEEVVLLATETQDPDLAGLVLQQILEPFQEMQLDSSIETRGAVEDRVSREVQEQYEEHPYPRWIEHTRRRPSSVADVVRSIAGPGLGPLSVSPTAPKILIAGCGTGRHIFETHGRFPDAEITALDLSRASLGYAARKLADAGVRARLIQADILTLGSWDETFDVVDSSGVLHHLADPVAGWRILKTKMKPGGLMRVGLYSELARRGVVELREYVNELGFDATEDGMREARRAMAAAFRDEPNSPTGWRDFYSMEECRDLLFHVQEHRMTLAQIADVLDELKLEFLGLEIRDSQTRESFRRRFPDPASRRSLECWHAYEQAFPDTFGAMYQFWVRKA